MHLPIRGKIEHLRFTIRYQHTNDSVQAADMPIIPFRSTGLVNGRTHVIGDQENLTLNKSQSHYLVPETAKNTIKEYSCGIHAKRMNIPSNDFCRSCRDEDEEITSEHLLWKCIKFAIQQLNVLEWRKKLFLQ